MTGPGLRRVLLLGGTSEIGLATLRALAMPTDAHVILAGRDEAGLATAAAALTAKVTTDVFDATDPASVADVVRRAFAGGPVDLVLPAFGVLGDQAAVEQDPSLGDEVLVVNVVAQTRALLEAARLMRAQGHGVIVALSSVAAVRPRRANFVYGASKSALDSVARGLSDSLHGSGVRVVLVRPGFVIGRMTRGMKPAPMSSTPDDVGRAVATAVRSTQTLVWVPPRLRLLASLMRVLPRPLWRRLPR